MVRLGSKPLFEPGIYDPSGEGRDWTRLPALSPTALASIEAAEDLIGHVFPNSYKSFLRHIGPGCWANAYFPPPSGVYTFEKSAGNMADFIVIACNVDGEGNQVAINPADNKLYYCTHDPMGFAPAGDSFEEYMYKLTQFAKDNAGNTVAFYKSLEPFTEAVIPPEPEKKPWWMFWKFW
jgi:hypothetical protein